MKKSSKLSTRIAIILSLVIFITIFIKYGFLFVLMLPKSDHVTYAVTRLAMPLWEQLLFSYTFALIPIITILIWRFAPVTSGWKRMLTILIIVSAVLISILARREMIRSKAIVTNADVSWPMNGNSEIITTLIPIDIVHFELFAFGGLVVGSVISYYAFRNK